MKLIKSNLRWPGGKSRMMKNLDYFLPSKVDKYLEPFTGGGSVLLYIIQKYCPSLVYANDIDERLINYYNHVKNEPEQLIEDCKKIKNAYTAEEFREPFKKLDTSIAAEFFTANKASFSGMNNNYSIQAYNRNFTLRSIDKIEDISKVIKNVNFTNCDFKKLDEEIKEPIENYFIYLDPPYYSNRKIGLYGKKGELHKEFPHEAMLEWVNKHKDNNLIMISYDDSEYIRELYKDFYIYSFDFTYSMTNTGGNTCRVGQEIVITNYEIKFFENNGE